MTELPQSYVIHKFYQHAGYPRFKKSANTYEAGCPMCREGKSWGRKRRLYYVPDDNLICCHNCGWYGNTLKWVQHVECKTYHDVMNEITEGEYNVVDVLKMTEPKPVEGNNQPTLPHDSINLFSTQQTEYYKDKEIIKTALSYIKSRKLDTAINKPDALYMSLTDHIHKNRICIPAYSSTGKIIHYQTRKLLDDDSPKYLSKTNSEKQIFGLNNITDIYNTLYIFEGPIDSFFVENGVGIAGIQEKSNESLTQSQQETLRSYLIHKKTWVLDNQFTDAASMSKTKILLERGECVFIWPRELSKFKDFNDMCVSYNLTEISHKFIDANSYCGPSGLLKLV